MEKLNVELNNGKGEVQLWLGDEKVGFMEIAVNGERLTVYHTEVDKAHGGKGYGILLIGKLVDYARENDLKISPLCPYVRGQIDKHPELYADVVFKK